MPTVTPIVFSFLNMSKESVHGINMRNISFAKNVVCLLQSSV